MMFIIRDVFLQTSIAYLWLSPAIHLATIMLIIAVFRYGRKTSRMADAFFGVLFLFTAFSNHIAITENYGLVVITGNVVQIVVVGRLETTKYIRFSVSSFVEVLGNSLCNFSVLVSDKR